MSIGRVQCWKFSPSLPVHPTCGLQCRPVLRPVGMSPGPVQQAHRTSSGPEGSSDKVFPCVTQYGLGSSQRAVGRQPRFPENMTLKRMDNVLIVVDELEAVKSFFLELGLELEGETTVEGPLVDNLIGLKNVRATLAMLRPPNGQGGIELDKFHTPKPVRYGPINTP